MKESKIHTFYHPKMSLNIDSLSGYSQSPAKPKLLMEYMERKGLSEFFTIDSNFPLLERRDFYVAHVTEMVDNFFDKGKTNKLLHMKWTPEYSKSVEYGNAAMYAAIKYAVQHPEVISFNPFTGFHHANPTRSALFCAFSGQVIASMKVYYEFGLCGAYIDLDGHFGNSIDNSRDFVKDIDKAISPVCGNINIMVRHQAYLDELKLNLEILHKEIMEGRIHYVVFSHGADSHEWDELASQVTTEEWIESSRMVYTFIRDLQVEVKRHIPLIVTLCGGYRRDDYNSVLSLHTSDLVTCLNTLCGHQLDYKPEVSPRVVK